MAANLVTKLYLPSLADADAERLSPVMGTAAGEDVAQSRGWGPMGTRKGEHRRAIPVPLERPEALRGIGVSSEEILVRFARMPPARLWCPPYYLRPEYSDRIPAGKIKTVDLAVYHHLWMRAQGETPATGLGAPVLEPNAPPFVQTSPPRPEREVHLTDDHRNFLSTEAHVDLPPGDDIAALNRLIEALVRHIRHDERAILKGVCSGGRLVELRVHPEAVAQICRGAEAMHILSRRWSALRWVRRVRPTFVLSKRALDALDPDLLKDLSELCAREQRAARHLPT